ncbi:radical SAM protein [Desulfitobacterium sp.]|uniref:radical SAM protein n=1 Tax=Desulfitobacterium sp. TaxID=49981 RepID=UPI002B1EBC9F|nr:radical SAM protein [Desulfitobacterium sp.]MEA4902154.1 radical SAM protein [Desulfitobacterium sp.]
MPLLFKTENNNWYFYDDATRMTFPTEGYEKDYLEHLENIDEQPDIIKMKQDTRLHSLTEKAERYGLFKNTYLLTTFKEEDVRNKLKKEGIGHLCLILTESCNFRCKYCIYSDHYTLSNGYSDKEMSFDTAKSAIDKYMDNNIKSLKYNPNLSISIGFYGGEPLLNFKTITRVVHYVEDKYKSYFFRTIFAITTNGYLLDEEKIQFMLDHNFAISISLDGGEQEHNRNRVTINNRPTFDIVYQNLLILDKKFNERFSFSFKNDIYPYVILVTYDNFTDLQEVYGFFKNHPDLDKRISRISKVKDLNSNYYLNSKQSDNGTIQKQKDAIDSFLYMIKFDQPITNFIRKYVQGIIFEPSTNINYNYDRSRGLCFPGISKLAVDVNGNFHMCEKISLQYPIGNVEQGFDVKKQIKYLNMALSKFENRCEKCNVRNLCTICYVTLECSELSSLAVMCPLPISFNY